MKVLVLGGTGFVGRHVVARLLAAGDEVVVAHRGPAEPVDFPDVPHLHGDRRAFAGTGAFRPDAVVDCCAWNGADVRAVHPHLLADAHLVEVSSQDVYRAYELMRAGREGVPVPGDETAPLREQRDPADDKLDVEPATLARAGTVLRLAMVYGEHDPQRREELVLRRVRAGRGRRGAGRPAVHPRADPAPAHLLPPGRGGARLAGGRPGRVDPPVGGLASRAPAGRRRPGLRGR